MPENNPCSKSASAQSHRWSRSICQRPSSRLANLVIPGNYHRSIQFIQWPASWHSPLTLRRVAAGRAPDQIYSQHDNNQINLPHQQRLLCANLTWTFRINKSIYVWEVFQVLHVFATVGNRTCSGAHFDHHFKSNLFDPVAMDEKTGWLFRYGMRMWT